MKGKTTTIIFDGKNANEEYFKNYVQILQNLLNFEVFEYINKNEKQKAILFVDQDWQEYNNEMFLSWLEEEIDEDYERGRGYITDDHFVDFIISMTQLRVGFYLSFDGDDEFAEELKFTIHKEEDIERAKKYWRRKTSIHKI